MKLPEYPIAHRPISARWGIELLDYIRAQTLREGPGYQVKRSSSGVSLAIKSNGSSGFNGFSGNGWVGSQYVTGYNTDSSLPWVKVVLSTEAVSEVLGPPSNPCPDGEVWFKKSATHGDFRVDRVG